ncbi:hypothetical protein BC829DRAFT_485866 [Chytridium lagenaria]|nr:hypothetical protein BC829DRAFT_485866 [Chytridium lagenaria]
MTRVRGPPPWHSLKSKNMRGGERGDEEKKKAKPSLWTFGQSSELLLILVCSSAVKREERRGSRFVSRNSRLGFDPAFLLLDSVTEKEHIDTSPTKFKGIGSSAMLSNLSSHPDEMECLPNLTGMTAEAEAQPATLNGDSSENTAELHPDIKGMDSEVELRIETDLAAVGGMVGARLSSGPSMSQSQSLDLNISKSSSPPKQIPPASPSPPPQTESHSTPSQSPQANLEAATPTISNIQRRLVEDTENVDEDFLLLPENLTLCITVYPYQANKEDELSFCRRLSH